MDGGEKRCHKYHRTPKVSVSEFGLLVGPRKERQQAFLGWRIGKIGR